MNKLTLNEVWQIVKKLSLEHNMISDYDLYKDVSCIVYRNDLFEYGGNKITEKHIDIEFTFGEYYELHSEDNLFQSICLLCDLPESVKEEEIILYQKP